MPQSAPASGPNATGDVGMDDAHHLLDQIPPRCVLDFFAVQACLPGRRPPAADGAAVPRAERALAAGLTLSPPLAGGLATPPPRPSVWLPVLDWGGADWGATHCITHEDKQRTASVMTLLNICGKFMDNSFLLVGLGLSSLLFAYFLQRAFTKVKNCSSSPNNLDEDCGLLLPATRLYCIFFFGKTLADLLFGTLNIVVLKFECSYTLDRHAVWK